MIAFASFDFKKILDRDFSKNLTWYYYKLHFRFSLAFFETYFFYIDDMDRLQILLDMYI